MPGLRRRHFPCSWGLARRRAHRHYAVPEPLPHRPPTSRRIARSTLASYCSKTNRHLAKAGQRQPAPPAAPQRRHSSRASAAAPGTSRRGGVPPARLLPRLPDAAGTSVARRQIRRCVAPIVPHVALAAAPRTPRTPRHATPTRRRRSSRAGRQDAPKERRCPGGGGTTITGWSQVQFQSGTMLPHIYGRSPARYCSGLAVSSSRRSLSLPLAIRDFTVPIDVRIASAISS